MGWVVKARATQDVIDPATGEIVTKVGDESDDLDVLDEPNSIYRAFAVKEEKASKEKAPKHEAKETEAKDAEADAPKVQAKADVPKAAPKADK